MTQILYTIRGMKLPDELQELILERTDGDEN